MTTTKTYIPNTRFSTFVGEWDKIKLEELLTFKNGINADKEKYGHGIKFINVLDIINNQYITYDNILGEVEVSEKEFEKNKVEFGDILFQRSSETREEVGQANVYLDKDKSAVFGGFVIRGKKVADYHPFFMKILLGTEFVRKEITTRSGGSTRYNVGQDILKDVEVVIPTLPEQQKIASFLSAVDQKIQQLTRKKELLEQYKKGVMQKIFSREIRFKDENGKDYPDWKEKQLSEFLIPTFREVPTPSEHYLAIGIRSHCRGTFQKPYSDPNAIAMDKLFLVRENDLIVNITFAWEGAIAMVKKEDDGGFVSHRFPTYTFDRKVVLNEFFKYVFVLKRFRYTLDLISPGGAGRNRVLSKKELLKINWTMPLIKEQKKIASFLEIIDKKIKNATYQLTQTQQFKKGLLQQMFV